MSELDCRWTRAAVATAFALAVGCADRTSLLVQVSSDDLTVPADVDGLRFVVQTEAGHSIDRAYDIEGAWPHSLTVMPASSQEGRVTITVTGTLGGRPVVRRIVESAFSPGEQRTVVVELHRACLGLPCPDGVDCVGGICVGQPLDDGGVDGGLDGGPRDGGVDAGGLDAGSDAGSHDAGVPDGGSAAADGGADTDAGPTMPPRLLFTEYVEGSSNNKALEIHNLGSARLDLSRCGLERYSNGSAAAADIVLSGTVAAGGFFVVCNNMIDITAACDQLTGALNHNGDDAYALVCDGSPVPIDTFGQIGTDPGTAWEDPAGTLSTVDFVLTRRCSVSSGDPNGTDPFDPSVEWEGVPWSSAAASLAGLGHRAECP